MLDENETLRAGMRMARLAGWIMVAMLIGGSVIAAAVIHGSLTRCECPECAAPVSPYVMIGERLDGAIGAGDYAMYDPPAAATATFFSITPIGDVIIRGLAGCMLGRFIVVSVPGTAKSPLRIADEDKPDGFSLVRGTIDRRLFDTLTIATGTSVQFFCDGRRWMAVPRTAP